MISAIIYFVVFSALLAAFLLIPKKLQTRRIGLFLLLLSLTAELFVFNIHSFALLPGGYRKTEVDLNAPDVDLSATQGNQITLELNDIGQKVGTLHFACTLPPAEKGDAGTPYVDVTVDARDVTQQGYYRSAVASGQIVRGDDRSAYLVLNLSGEVSDLRLRLTAKEGCSFALNGLTLNATVPMHFSALRLLLLVGGIFGIWALAVFPSLRRSYGDGRLFCRRAALVMTVFLLLCAVCLHFARQYDQTQGISAGFAMTSGNQITQELVDAFEAGQVSLLDKPPQELLELENPYDWSERVSAGVSYKWDHLLYDGKYYSYYGIAPVILLFLPYHLLTGYYFPTPEAVLLFGCIGILFLSLLYLAFCDLFAKKIPANMVLMGLLVLQLSSGVWYNFCSPLFYEIAQTAGFCFTTAGFFFLLRSGVVGQEHPVRPGWVVLSTVCLSLGVLSRPTLALYCIAALFFLWYGLRKYRRQAEERHHGDVRQRRRATAVYLLAALGAFVVIGGVQMWYNYARFGSVLDFGIQYSLTINDFTRSQYHTGFVMIGIFNFLFAFPSVRPEFPYIFPSFSTLGTNGYYFIANTNATGVFFRALPSLGLLGAAPAWKALSRRERRAALCLLLPVCLLVPLGILISIWESGYSVRYATDFYWPVILGGTAVLFLLYVRRAEGQTRRLMQAFFLASAVVALVCNFGLIYDYLELSGYLESQALSFARLFDFWK